MIIIPLVLVFQAQDTSSLRQAFHEAIRATYAVAMRQTSAPIASAEHVILDQQSFKRLAGVDSTAPVDWSSLATAAGPHGTAQRGLRCRNGLPCTEIVGVHFARTADTISVTIAVWQINASHRASRNEYIVKMTRQAGAFVVDTVIHSGIT